ncbi:MAG: FmdB family zinc ribbon protein [Dehalococcoidia bacterium]
MPVYEYYCRACQNKFELLRPMKLSEREAPCPAGHQGAQRMISVFSATSKGTDGESASFGGGGGCACGGACSCGGH